MPWIDDSWLREAYQSLKETFRVDDRTRNEMIQFLLDEGFWNSETLKTFDAQVARWNACLNPNKPEFFKVGEVWALMMRFNRHDLFHAMARDLGYEVRAVPTEARRQDLLERIATATEACETEVARARAALERIGQPHAGARLPSGGRFSMTVVTDETPAAAARTERLACP